MGVAFLFRNSGGGPPAQRPERPPRAIRPQDLTPHPQALQHPSRFTISTAQVRCVCSMPAACAPRVPATPMAAANGRAVDLVVTAALPAPCGGGVVGLTTARVCKRGGVVAAIGRTGASATMSNARTTGDCQEDDGLDDNTFPHDASSWPWTSVRASALFVSPSSAQPLPERREVPCARALLGNTMRPVC